MLKFNATYLKQKAVVLVVLAAVTARMAPRSRLRGDNKNNN